ncbi:MAG: hypothetical protein E6I38_05350 [Chloroflexi bacterium]|nr:MAG: hypothetical protein E6I38_05350 [Chloroflexota bacterium]
MTASPTASASPTATATPTPSPTITASPSTSASPTASPTPGPYGVVDQQQEAANVPLDPVQYGQSFTPGLNNVAGFDFYFQTPSTAVV